MIVTEEFLKKYATPTGNNGTQFAWKKAHIQALGLKYPTKKGWFSLIVGKEITDEQAKQYIAVNNGRINKNIETRDTIESKLEYRWKMMLTKIKELGGEDMAEDFLKEIDAMYSYEKKVMDAESFQLKMFK